MAYEQKNFEHLLGLPGFSDTLLKNHFALYSGYVKNFNALVEIIKKMGADKYGTPEFAEVNRRLGWEFNGVRMHELYFENLTKSYKQPNQSSRIYRKISEVWGSFESWEKEFRALGAMRGIGWVVLYHDKATGQLFNVWINEHDVGHFAGCTPLLVMDVFEHAYLSDYGLKRADYINAFMNVVNWVLVEQRL